MTGVKSIIHKWSWILLVAFCTVGLVYPYIGAIALICMLAPVVLAFFKGRMWCGKFCPRGSFNDIILSKLSRKNTIPGLLKSTWFRNLFLAVLMSAFAVQMVFAWGSASAVGQVFVRMIIITTLLAVILGIFFNHRTWCMICPMGTMAHYAAKVKALKTKLTHVNFNKNTCVNCKVCSKSCPMGIEVFNHKNKGKVFDPDCLKCSECVDKCPKKSLFIS